MDKNANAAQANNKRQSFYKQRREPGSPDIFTFTISNRNRNISIIKNIWDESKKKARDISIEKLLENDEISVLDNNSKKNNFFLNPNFKDIKCKKYT